MTFKSPIGHFDVVSMTFEPLTELQNGLTKQHELIISTNKLLKQKQEMHDCQKLKDFSFLMEYHL